MSGGSQNTVSQQTIPNWLQPYYTQALSQGQNLLQQGGPQYYPGQQVAPLSGMQQQGLQSMAGATPGATAAGNSALNANQYETSGALLNPNANPYLSGMFQQGANQIQNNLNSEFAGAGSNIANSAPVQANEMGNLATSLYGGEYQTGLQNMTAAQALTPQLQQGAYTPGQELLQGGSTMQQQQQNEINAAMQRYSYNQNLPYNTLSWYSGLMNQNASPFQSSSSTGTMSNNPVTTGIGLGMTGLGAYEGLALAGLLG